MKTIAFGRFELPLGETPLIVGILNLTPDSFSDGGEYASFEAAALIVFPEYARYVSSSNII